MPTIQQVAIIDATGTFTMPSGDAAARGIYHRITDGTNTAAVKAASTAPVATDPAIVVTISPNSPGMTVAQGAAAATHAGYWWVRVTDGVDDIKLIQAGDTVVPATDTGFLVFGTDGTNYRELKTQTDGALIAMPKALTSGAMRQVTIGVVAVQVDTTPLANRKTISVKAARNNTVTIYVGFASTVTTATGFELGPGDAQDIEVDATVTVYAIASAAAQGISVMEVAG